MLPFIVNKLYSNAAYIFNYRKSLNIAIEQWPKHVGVLYIRKLVQFVADELVYVYQLQGRGTLLSSIDCRTTKGRTVINDELGKAWM